MKYICNVPDFKDNYLENLLKFRGINDVRKFLRPTGDCLNNPSLLKNIDIAANTIIEMIDKSQEHMHIGIVCDSDVDGYTSSAIIMLYLQKMWPQLKLSYFIHEAKQHGAEDFEQEIIAQEINILIVPDAGSSEYELHERLFNRGITVICLDHHLAEKDSKYAIVVNNQISESYPNKALSGAGITWQFCRYLDSIKDTKFANGLIDLAALGIN